MPEPCPPLTADELLDCFALYAQSEMIAQLRIDHADDFERRALDRCAIRRWKNAYKENA